MGAFIALISCIVVVLLLVLRQVVATWIQRRMDGRCFGRCGKNGWTILRDDGNAVTRRCNRCFWVSRFYRARKTPMNE